MVVGNFPDGETSPDTTSASALPHSCPGNQVCMIAATLSAHGIDTGDAALTMTTVRELTAAMARTSSSCGGGSDIESRSLPSVSQSLSVPTTQTTASARRASATA